MDLKWICLWCPSISTSLSSFQNIANHTSMPHTSILLPTKKKHLCGTFLMGIPHISIPRLGFNMVFKDPNLRFPTGAWRISGARSRLKEPFNCTASAASTTTGLKPCSRQREALLRWRFKETKPGFWDVKILLEEHYNKRKHTLSRYFLGCCYT